MSASMLSGGPAFTALRPPYPSLEDLAPERERALRALAGPAARVRSLGPAGATIEGRYVVEREGEAPRFLKVFPESLGALQRHSAKVAAYLCACGIPAITAFDAEPRPAGPGFLAHWFPYFPARFSAFAPAELATLGSTLARMHAALAAYPGADAVRVDGEALRERLERAARSIVATGARGLAHGELREAAARSFVAGGWEIFRAPRMVHGDCNYTNVLFGVPSGELRIVDFEESAAAWLDPVFDLAMATQRFACVSPGEDADALAATLWRAYGAAAGTEVAPRRVARAMSEAVHRSVLILHEKVGEGLAIPDAEWTKFERLARLAEGRGARPREG
jgi:hypothetical protein